MAGESNDPVFLTSAPSDAEAALIVAALEDRGINAHSTGELTAGFRAEGPGVVRILVPASELEAAREVWEEIREQWSHSHNDDEEDDDQPDKG